MKTEDNILGQIYFTEYDENITGTTLRDPLGLQPIWSYYGRRVISHLTTVSNDIRGFREVLLCLEICRNSLNKKRNESFRELILIFEQLFIYSTIKYKKSEGIIGSDNGIKRYRNEKENPKISSEDTILKSQISLGYFGRYKTPMNTMQIIDTDGCVEEDVDVPVLYGDKRFNKIQASFEDFLESKNRRFDQFRAARDLFDAVTGRFREGEKEFWLEHLQIKGSNKIELMNKAYGLARTDSNVQMILSRLENYVEVKDILRLEPFFRCLESVFFEALRSKNIYDMEIKSKDLEEHLRRYEDFISIDSIKKLPEGILRKRVKFIMENCSPKSGTYIRSVIEYHKVVCDQKGNSVWLEIDSDDNIRPFMSIDMDTRDFLKSWGRDYYFLSLLSVKNGIEELG